MKNINRYKLIPVLIIGLVLSTFSAMAEVKSIILKSKAKATIEIKEGEVGQFVNPDTTVIFNPERKGIYYKFELQIEIDGKKVVLFPGDSRGLISPFKIAGPAKIHLFNNTTDEPSSIFFSIKLTPNKKH